MKRLTKEVYEQKLKKLQYKNLLKLRKRKLRQEKYKMWPKIKLPSTSKLVLLGVFLMCIEIMIFAQYAMIVLGDTSAMYALIGVPAALIPVCLGYFSKAKAENTVGGIKFETAINNQNVEYVDVDTVG